MYVRFVSTETIRGSSRRIGVFQPASSLQRWGGLAPYYQWKLDELLGWFSRNLQPPSRFTNSKPPYYRRSSFAICWFKDSATEHIRKAREMSFVLGRHGIRIEMITTQKPGYVVYQDEFQVAAEPFADTGA